MNPVIQKLHKFTSCSCSSLCYKCPEIPVAQLLHCLGEWFSILMCKDFGMFHLEQKHGSSDVIHGTPHDSLLKVTFHESILLCATFLHIFCKPPLSSLVNEVWISWMYPTSQKIQESYGPVLKLDALKKCWEVQNCKTLYSRYSTSALFWSYKMLFKWLQD